MNTPSAIVLFGPIGPPRPWKLHRLVLSRVDGRLNERNASVLVQVRTSGSGWKKKLARAARQIGPARIVVSDRSDKELRSVAAEINATMKDAVPDWNHHVLVDKAREHLINQFEDSLVEAVLVEHEDVNGTTWREILLVLEDSWQDSGLQVIEISTAKKRNIGKAVRSMHDGRTDKLYLAAAPMVSDELLARWRVAVEAVNSSM